MKMYPKPSPNNPVITSKKPGATGVILLLFVPAPEPFILSFTSPNSKNRKTK